MSAHQIHRQLGITYKTAWFMAHRIRYAMTQEPLKTMLSGTVEVDETYIGGKAKAGRGRSTKKKTPVVALVERDGKVKSKPVKRVSADELKGAIRESVEISATIMTDEWASYKEIGKEYEGGHHVVNHSRGEYVRGEASTNTVESYFALLKRGVNGTFHHISNKHLHRYCDEFSFRWNHRKDTDSERSESALRLIEGICLKYKNSIYSTS
jgi:transposase-like protein